jgi:WD repeat-containing protein 26
MIPESRLENLLRQAKDSWISNCLYHTWNDEPSLYIDHACSKDHFPLKCQHVLNQHDDEVWYLKFSNDGKKLATTSKDHTICIYRTDDYELLYRLEDHEAGVCYVAWSPDDTKLISCGQQQDNSCKMWSLQVQPGSTMRHSSRTNSRYQTGQTLFTLRHYTYAVTSAAWAPDGMQFVTGSQDTDHALELYDLDGTRIHIWSGENFRVHDVGITPDGSTMVVLTERSFAVYDFHTRDQLYDYHLDLYGAKLTSLNISHDSRSMLLSMNENRMQLRDIHTGTVEAEFGGHKQTQYIIRSAFGGADENFVVSGSEDSRIYIWRRNGMLVEALDAHEEGCVNAVAWHPTDARIFASAGDDRKVRIWCPISWPTGNGSVSPVEYYS